MTGDPGARGEPLILRQLLDRPGGISSRRSRSSRTLVTVLLSTPTALPQNWVSQTMQTFRLATTRLIVTDIGHRWFSATVGLSSAGSAAGP